MATEQKDLIVVLRTRFASLEPGTKAACAFTLGTLCIGCGVGLALGNGAIGLLIGFGGGIALSVFARAVGGQD